MPEGAELPSRAVTFNPVARAVLGRIALRAPAPLNCCGIDAAG